MSNFAANQIYKIMYSSEDLERFYFQYQTEALPRGESLQSFCLKNKVPYNIFQKWFRSCFEFLQKVFLGLMYPFSCVLWAIFWPFSLLSENVSKTHPKSSHDKFKTVSKRTL